MRNTLHITSVVVLLAITSLLLTNNLAEEGRQPGSSQTAENQLEYLIALPETWEVKEAGGNSGFLALAPKSSDEDLFRENINIISTTMDHIIDRERFYRLNIETLDSILTDFDLESKEKVEINGLPAKKIVYTHRIGPVNLRVMQYLIVHGSDAFIMTFTSDLIDFDVRKRDFLEVANTFKVHSL